ncbi:MAG: multidrug transporter [Flavobacteriaceae bacterium]|uniref:multidrug transporter n=1 Tax=Mariniflexile sp. TaxID=1979402 RepID=UPI003CA696FF
MKNNFLTSLLAVAILMASCATDDTADIIINVTNNNGTSTSTGATVRLSGTYTTSLTLDINNTYILAGSLVMASGTTLTIPAGMTIKADASGSDVYIAIAQGAKIVAIGTATSPIIFTSGASSPKAGDWGGLILLGKAPTNAVTGTATATSEIGGLPYGGNISNDDSGSLKYVRIEYSGASADAASENNGLSLYGVGSGTSIEYIQVVGGKDDGVEFFGGTVNASYLSVINAEDDSIDWTEGYSGTLTNVYIKHIQNPTVTFCSDKAFECDGFNPSFGNNSSPIYYSNPKVNNVTIIGASTGSGTLFQDGAVITAGTYEAVRLRVGTQGTFTNIKMTGFGEGFDLDNDITGDGVIADKLQVNGILFTDVTTKMKNDTGKMFTIADFITADGTATGTDYATWGAGWTVQ